MAEKFFDVGGSKSLMYGVDTNGNFHIIKLDSNGNIASGQSKDEIIAELVAIKNKVSTESKQDATNTKLDSIVSKNLKVNDLDVSNDNPVITKDLTNETKQNAIIETIQSGNSKLDAIIANFGGKYIADTSETTPEEDYVFNAIQVIVDCVITAVGNITGITSTSLTTGTIIYGRFTSVTLASGSVIAYNGV